MATLLDYKDNLRDILEDQNDTRWPEADKAKYINRAMRQIVKDCQPLQAWVTLAANGDSTSEYVMPDGTEFYALKGHVQTSTQKLSPINPEQAYSVYGPSWDTQAGTPTRYMLGPFGRGVFRVLPYPSTALTDLKAWVSKYAAALAVDADESDLPAELDDAVAYRAAMFAYSLDTQERNPEKAQIMDGLYQQEIAKFFTQRAIGFDTTPKRINRSYF